jgi:hypothetical protein
MIATLPRSIAIREAARECLVILEFPYEPLRVRIETVWHARGDPGHGAKMACGPLHARVADLNG